MRQPVRDEPRRGIPLRALVPNAVTALALCSGLTGVRFAIEGNWERALFFVIVAAVLDGMDGRIARMLKGQSRFGAELDSLSDVIAFGVSPAVIIYLWSLQQFPRYGWIFALAHAVCAALRLARFNANIDAEEQPHKSAGFFTGVPAPAGAGLALLPIYLWLWTENETFREFWLVAPWAAIVAVLMISNVATFSWTSFRLRSHVRFWMIGVIALVGGALFSAPWPTLSVIALIYALSIPFSSASYARVRRQRRAAAARRRAPDAT
ncbi:MAG TPA: CDP-diacylglycerol--serine O-phosphatidyltransferase [Allosphingosinicella sp.]|nr:CDP-diacylglycerol--serine O-phosphatidyltransferase [Allosphingosinicella sp.]